MKHHEDVTFGKKKSRRKPKPETTREPKKPRDLEDDGNGIFLRLEMVIVDV